jgi:hypothetical protein
MKREVMAGKFELFDDKARHNVIALCMASLAMPASPSEWAP